MTLALTRRRLMGTSAALVALAALRARAAAEPVELEWNDLVPRPGEGEAYTDIRVRTGIIEHADLATGFEQSTNASVNTEYNGKRVAIPGFMVPLDYEGFGVTVFLLVPYVGACIHVPPPPPNQIIYVDTATPYEVTGYFEAIVVTGTISTMAKATELAEIGYRITADHIEPYE